MATSTRDEETASRLRECGIPASATGCPTLVYVGQPGPSARLAAEVVVAAGGWDRPERASELLNALSGVYDRVLIWPQGAIDRDRLRKLTLPSNSSLLPGQLAAFDDALQCGGRDYVGLRLHAGIRAMQLGSRAAIVSTDHRASNMASTFGLPIFESVSSAVQAMSIAAEPSRPLESIAADARNRFIEWRDQVHL